HSRRSLHHSAQASIVLGHIFVSSVHPGCRVHPETGAYLDPGIRLVPAEAADDRHRSRLGLQGASAGSCRRTRKDGRRAPAHHLPGGDTAATRRGTRLQIRHRRTLQAVERAGYSDRACGGPLLAETEVPALSWHDPRARAAANTAWPAEGRVPGAADPRDGGRLRRVADRGCPVREPATVAAPGTPAAAGVGSHRA